MVLLGAVFMVGAFVLAALFGNEHRSQDWDPMYARDVVLRSMRFGGTFVENGLVNKGPLEAAVYRLAASLSSYDGYWFVISAFVLIAAALIG
ncbi:MAG TPA: hypothetical protein PLV68_11815 [Ilumatobacteraceae bacterium]|nr:hypothetical protein [Ilumatobacteraceae bacterium]